MRISDWSSDVCSSDLELAKGALVVLPAAMGLFEKGVGQRLDRLAERFGQPLGLGRVEVESRDLDGRCGDIRQLIAGMGLDVFELAAVARAVERHDDGGDAGVAKPPEQAALCGVGRAGWWERGW